jgi:hypothetical protein
MSEPTRSCLKIQPSVDLGLRKIAELDPFLDGILRESQWSWLVLLCVPLRPGCDKTFFLQTGPPGLLTEALTFGFGV